MKYKKHFDHWTVLYSSGHRVYFKCEETASQLERVDILEIFIHDFIRG
jgi:hypothetical protein